jgi:2-keto-4-pentenoate hydratase/2-oxohepta-3-ene-1,7-dioic acid hydratase in catechol pathway
MRLATFAPKRGGVPRVGVAVGSGLLDVVEAGRLAGPVPMAAGSLKALFAAGDAALEDLRGLAARAEEAPGRFAAAWHPLHAVRFLPPIPDPEKFLCVGKNYRGHLEELKRSNLIREMPTEPTGFVKIRAALTGHDNDVVRPADVTHLDYEPELTFVIGRGGSRIDAGRAFEHVVGITLLNDLTCRDTQLREVASGTRFWTAKNAPGFGPVGPYVVTMDEVGDPYDLWLSCRVDGETRMRVNTREQIWKLPDIVAHFSRLLPLAPGDLFSTGAPGGVAVGKPNAEELYLRPGQVVECVLDRPELVLRNRIVSPDTRPEAR